MKYTTKFVIIGVIFAVLLAHLSTYFIYECIESIIRTTLILCAGIIAGFSMAVQFNTLKYK